MERSAREKVLIVLHSDGWVEAYSEEHVDVWIVNRPHVTTAKAGALADEYLEVSLPGVYAELFWPQMLRKTLRFEKITPVGLQWREWRLGFFRTLERIRRKLSYLNMRDELNFQLDLDAKRRRNAQIEAESLQMSRKPHVDQSSVE